MADPEHTTEQLKVQQQDRKDSERAAAHDAPTEDAQRAHRRRADKAAYLEEKLDEQQRSEES